MAIVDQGADQAAEKRAERGVSLMRNRWLRILGVAFVMYVLS